MSTTLEAIDIEQITSLPSFPYSNVDDPAKHSVLLHETIQAHPAIARLFLSLLRPQAQTQLFVNLADHCQPCVNTFVKARVRVAALHSPNFEKRFAHFKEDAVEKDSRHYLSITTDSPEYYKPEDKFHYAFGVYPFAVSLDPADVKRPTSFLTKEDRLAQWQCSKYVLDKKAHGRAAAVHLMGLEGLLQSVVVGGYFGAVLPKRWVGRQQQYLRWWQQRAAIVARVDLPPAWIKAISRPNPSAGALHEIPVPGGWELMLWQRAPHYDESTANSKSYSTMMRWVELRHSPFLYKIEADVDKDGFPQENQDSINKAIAACARAFQASEWWGLSVSHFNEFIENNNLNPVYGNHHLRPHTLPKVEDTWILDPAPEKQYHIRVLPTRGHISGLKNKEGKWILRPIPNAVDIRVTNKIKLAVYGPGGLVSAGLLLDFRNEEGITTTEGNREFALDKALKKRDFSEYREELLQKLEKRGLIPCMTDDNHRRFLRKERWLSLQLTPVERMIPVQKARSSDELSSDERSWELIYEDIGLEATYPEVLNLWRSRAKKIGLNRTGVTYEFQMDDIVVQALKSSALNGNVMGLGKTRETLFTFILRGNDHLLIICPTKLIGVWQDEIRDTIAPYMSKQRRNWNGKLMKCSLNIIQNAQDLLRPNLKTFNIISYDTLKSVPKDSQFYKCPKCGVIVCKKHRSDYTPTCPGNPAQPESERCDLVVQRWMEANKHQGLRKAVYLLDQDGKVLFEIKNPTTKKNRKLFPEERRKVVDSRPPRPEVQRMEELDCLHKKYRCVYRGMRTDPLTGEQKPHYDWVERKVGPAAIHVKWTFANLIRRRFNIAAADEAQYASNEDAQRTIALLDTRCVRHKLALTGTPVKGYPKKIIPVLNWAFPRALFPDYQLYDPDGESNFLKKFQTEVQAQDAAKWTADEDGGTSDPEPKSKKDRDKRDEKMLKSRKPAASQGTRSGEWKVVPKINNPELFQAELAPVMVRHLRTEPKVVAAIPRKQVVSLDHAVTMDEDHKEYYQLWIDSFAEWFQTKKEEVDKEKAGEGPLIAKLMYLYHAAVMPHFMLDNIEKTNDEEVKRWANLIGRYDVFLRKKYAKLGKPMPPMKPTAKFLRLRELLIDAINQGDKSIVFCTRRANLSLIERWCQQAKIGHVRVDGTVSLKIKDGESRSERHALVDQFRYDPQYRVMAAGLEAMAEGMNVPEANHGFIFDYTWDPTAIRQGIGRMIRPAQTKTIYAHYLYHVGTIEQYMCGLCYLKGRSGDEGIDYMSFSDFTGALVPDIHQFAKAIVDGTEKVMAARMFAAVDYLKKHGADEDEGGLYAGG